MPPTPFDKYSALSELHSTLVRTGVLTGGSFPWGCATIGVVPRSLDTSEADYISKPINRTRVSTLHNAMPGNMRVSTHVMTTES